MVAIAFAYANYRFARLHFIDFSEWVFYTGDGTVFEPMDDSYILLFYSSLQSDAPTIAKAINNKNGFPILALDLAQTRLNSQDNVIYITAGINTLLPVLRRFNVIYSPSVMLIERQKGALFKQSTLVESL
ncbi:hypothetical protein AGMMS50229_03210 [Campylobacterota bacterium]|nr:hypothetical protein AGMMS50229_03210 [Campylobacterota bacterium]